MSAFENLLSNSSIQRILTHPDEDDAVWGSELDIFLNGNIKLTRNSIGESSIKAIQRLLIFLGYSTSSTGAFVVDGDFGRGANRAVAQFSYDVGLNTNITRKTLCYPCRWNTAHKLIKSIPEVVITKTLLKKMAGSAIDAIDNNNVITGDFENALHHLNAVHKRSYLNCKQILYRYGDYVYQASEEIVRDEGIYIRPEWMLAIIRQETEGIIRPRFEQHKLSSLNKKSKNEKLLELRMQAMSLGLGQIMGFNYKLVGAESAHDLYTASEYRQVKFVANYLKLKKNILKKSKPSKQDFRQIAKYYNGPKYAAHEYHEKLERWFDEFAKLPSTQ